MKIRLLVVLTILTLAAPNAVPAQQKNKGKFAYSGFSGGMMVHTGYLFGGDITLTDGLGNYRQKLSGAPTGIGGAARVHLGKHLRVGGEGYVTTLKYGKHDSYATIGWGGVLADCIWRFGRWAPYVGTSFGGGSMKNLTLTSPTPLDDRMEERSSFRKFGFLTLVPFAGVEFTMTDKIRLSMKADWMCNLTNRQPDFVTGPRIYIGFAFYRTKE